MIGGDAELRHQESKSCQSRHAAAANMPSNINQGKPSIMRIFVIAAATIAFAAGSASAQTPTPEQKAKAEAEAAKLAAADANKDGKWSKAEWQAAGRRPIAFDKVDANKDGFVGKDELKAAAAARNGG
jgi:hypothetical protein